MLIILGSPWQAILAKSYIAKEKITEYELVIEKSTESSFQEILKILETTEEDIKIIVIWEKLKVLSIKKLRIAKKYIDTLNQALDSDHYFAKVKTVMVFSEQNVFFKLFLNKFKNGKTYIKGEDGVLDYLPALKKHNFWKIAISKVLLGKRANLYTYKSIYSRFKTVIMFKKLDSVTNEQFVSLTEFKYFITTILNKEYKNVELPDNIVTDKNLVLLLCQSLSEDKVLALDEEIKIYERYVKKCLNHKYKVLIKPHPRSAPEKLSKLRSLVSGDVKLYESFGTPAEVFLIKGNFKEVMGVYSNTIIYAQSLFGVKGVSLLNQGLVENLSGDNKKQFRYIKKQLNKYFKEEYVEFE